GVFKNCKNFNKMRNVVAKTMCMSELIQKKSPIWQIHPISGYFRTVTNLLPEWAAITWLLLLRAGIQGFGCFAFLTHWLFQDKESFGSQHIFSTKK
ncbi:hypothetical protein KKF97_13050, partial [Myxococcota bacterium]|nr:hypothetical protein [Myxococcota bacterium]